MMLTFDNQSYRLHLGNLMSEIRPANSRPDIQRPANEKPVKTEQKPKETESQRTEARHEVMKREVTPSPKLKGGNVDITV